VSGSIRVTASDVVGVEILPPIVARLRDQHPGLAVELALTDRVQDLVRREADIAVRMMRPRQGLLVARRVGQVMSGCMRIRTTSHGAVHPRASRILRTMHSSDLTKSPPSFARPARNSVSGGGRPLRCEPTALWRSSR
jgi:DNA-binding transcriptional LysR family regulator